ncbi:TATA box-binding protein-associated factor RNA polymerase I subunit D [Sphaerodactylus townsendi]|uniref:TATA box-binding protein-associated factor RNA polymerase I subunit D n=1 Tax=Sphaerodactylus townsendi TaxID=933632 RepID=UPI0020260E8C|nr:TATA box-binding protein-associated factor RNA polymerase I subunit D [Sphaerodactylus townsendi]
MEEDSSSDDSEGSSTQDPKPTSLASSSQPASRRKEGARKSARVVGQRKSPWGTEARSSPSAGSSAMAQGQPKLPMPKIDLKALFDYHFRRKQPRKRIRRSPETRVAAKRRKREPIPKRQLPRVSEKERRKRYRERRPLFPFVQKVYGTKHIPSRMECLFELASLTSFFKYVERLKYEHHLKKSLAELGAAEDLEQDGLEQRRHKYLDDDGPLSPIEETNEEDPNENCGTEDIGAKIVENSCFILSSKIPKKKKSKRRTKS